MTVKKTIFKISRNIPEAVRLELWVRAGGRCQFRGHNALLYVSPVTNERVNWAQAAHIYSFSPQGPRGRGPHATNAKSLNGADNLMLVCPACHRKIDQTGGELRYPAPLLLQWKKSHEERIKRVTGIAPEMKTQVVIYGSRIGEVDAPLQPDEAQAAVFPERYPASERPLCLSMKLEHSDRSPEFWRTEEHHLRAAFERQIRPLITEERQTHFSLFALADMPLLTVLGTLLNDKLQVDVYQRFREPQGWAWQCESEEIKFLLKKPKVFSRKKPALVVSLSGHIDADRVRAAAGPNVAIWEITTAAPHNDFLRSRRQLAEFRAVVRKAMVQISAAHQRQPIRIFPAMPASCAVELGRVRMPKADADWIIYDEQGGFREAITLKT